MRLPSTIQAHNKFNSFLRFPLKIQLILLHKLTWQIQNWRKYSSYDKVDQKKDPYQLALYQKIPYPNCGNDSHTKIVAFSVSIHLHFSNLCWSILLVFPAHLYLYKRKLLLTILFSMISHSTLPTSQNFYPFLYYKINKP